VSANEFKYWAFISYSHRDLAWATWLQRALETYRLPRRLVGRIGVDGPLPSRLHPVFRDQEELPSGPSLSQAIDQALVASRYLIVIASPHAAVSQWVEQEIQRFRALDRGDRILCLIVDGDPDADPHSINGLQCLPPSLRRNPDLQANAYEPIAADVRPGHETRAAARLRLIAGLIGVGFDELRQRDRVRQRWRTAGWTAACLALATGLALFWQQQRALREQALAEQAREVHLRLVMDKAREEMLEHRPARAAVYLADAYRQGVDGPVLRRWLGRAMQYVEARRRVLETGAPVQLVRFGHDSNTVLSMGEDDHLQLWDVQTGQRRIDIDGGEHRMACQLSPDDRIVGCVAGEDFEQLRVWDLQTGDRRLALSTQPEGSANTLFGADHHLLAVIGTDHHPELHSADDPAHRLRLPIEASAISFDRSGRRLLVGGENGEVSAWDVETGRLLTRYPKMAAAIHWLDSSADGIHVAATDLLGTVRIWDAVNGRVRLSSGHTSNKINLRFDEQGDSLFSEGYDGVRVWDTVSGALKFALRTSIDNAIESRLSPDGKLLYTAGLSELRVHQVDAALPTYAVDGHLGAANDIDFSPDGRRLVTGAIDGRVIVWDLPQEPQVEFMHGEPLPATFVNDRIAGSTGIYSHDGRWIATASTDGAVRVWDAATHALLKQFDAVDPVAVDVLAISADDRVLAAGGDSGGIQLWSMPDGQALRKLDTGDGGPLWIELSGDRVVAAWTGHKSGIWRLSDGQSLGAWPRDYGPAQALTPDGKAFLIGTEGVLTLRRTDDASVIWTLKPGQGEKITAVAFSRDGRVLAVADKAHRLMTFDATDAHPLAQTTIPGGILTHGIAISDDGSVVAEADSNRNALLWWPARQRQLVLRGHAGIVQSVGFAPDQQALLTASSDGTARLWEVETGELIETVASHSQGLSPSPFTAGHFAPDGSRLLTAAIDGTVREWALPYETRSPQLVSDRVACSAPWKLAGETLVPVLPPAHDC
jgi:WD40 repeat protein